MEKLILAAYSGLTAASFLLSILAFTTLAKSFFDNKLDSTFRMACGLFIMSFFMFIDRAWWTIWKDRYISRETSAWMMDHQIPLLAPIAMTIGALLVILSLTEDSPYQRVFALCVGGVICVMFLGYVR